MRINSNKRTFAYINPESTAATDLGDVDLSSYSYEVIEFAKKLKGSHEFGRDPNAPQRFTDQYYIDYAVKYFERLKRAQFNAELYYKISRFSGSPVPDTNWAEYSYEEILAMSNNGVNVPLEVLEWAQGQQEGDLTAYVIISDNADNDDNSSTKEVRGESDINELREQTINYVSRANKKQKEAINKAEEIENKTKELTTRKDKFKSRLKNNKTKTDKLSGELETLENKKRENKLTAQDTVRYNKLRIQLGIESGENLQIQKEGEALEDFLNSIDTYNQEQDTAIKLNEEANDAAKNLGDIDKRSVKRTTKYNKFLVNNLANLDDIMAGINSESVVNIAADETNRYKRDNEQTTYKIKTDLKTTSFTGNTAESNKTSKPENTPNTNPEETTQEPISDNSSSIEEPSQEPSQEPILTPDTPSQEAPSEPSVEPPTEPQTETSQDTSAGTSSAENNNILPDIDLDNVKTEHSYGADYTQESKIGTIATTAIQTGALFAGGAITSYHQLYANMTGLIIPGNIINTALTLTTMATLNQNKKNVQKTEKYLLANTKTASKEVSDFEKQTDNYLKEHSSNLLKGENLAARVQELDTQAIENNKQQMLPLNPVKNDSGTKTFVISAPEQSDNSGERETIVGQLNNLSQSDNAVLDKAKINQKRVDKAQGNLLKSATNLDSQSQDLKQGAHSNEAASIATMLGLRFIPSGIQGAIIGHALIGLGNSMVASGTALLSNPTTHAMGIAMIAKGVVKIAEGTTGTALSMLTIGTSTLAGITGAAGLFESKEVKNDTKEHQKTTKNSRNEYNKNNKLFLKIRKAMAKAKLQKMPAIPALQIKGDSENNTNSDNNVTPAIETPQNTEPKTNNYEPTQQTIAQKTAQKVTQQPTVNKEEHTPTQSAPTVDEIPMQPQPPVDTKSAQQESPTQETDETTETNNEEKELSASDIRKMMLEAGYSDTSIAIIFKAMSDISYAESLSAIAVSSQIFEKTSEEIGNLENYTQALIADITQKQKEIIRLSKNPDNIEKIDNLQKKVEQKSSEGKNTFSNAETNFNQYGTTLEEQEDIGKEAEDIGKETIKAAHSLHSLKDIKLRIKTTFAGVKAHYKGKKAINASQESIGQNLYSEIRTGMLKTEVSAKTGITFKKDDVEQKNGESTQQAGNTGHSNDDENQNDDIKITAKDLHKMLKDAGYSDTSIAVLFKALSEAEFAQALSSVAISSQMGTLSENSINDLEKYSQNLMKDITKDQKEILRLSVDLNNIRHVDRIAELQKNIEQKSTEGQMAFSQADGNFKQYEATITGQINIGTEAKETGQETIRAGRNLNLLKHFKLRVQTVKAGKEANFAGKISETKGEYAQEINNESIAKSDALKEVFKTVTGITIKNENPEEQDNENLDDELLIESEENNEPAVETTQEPTPEPAPKDSYTLGAAASTNARITNQVHTDDKADRKLTRFNNDSIIESRKKRRKVLGVSKSSTNKSRK